MQNHIYLKIIAAKKLVEIKIKLFAPTGAKGVGEIALVGVGLPLPMRYLMQQAKELGSCR